MILRAGNDPKDRPRSVQVELNGRSLPLVASIMESCGYQPRSRHDTNAGKTRIAQGADPMSVAHNVLFVPLEASS